MGSLKRLPEGCFELGGDGVLRSFDGPYERNVIDAAGLSPYQIKQLLDTRPWSQEQEDKFRGVDGRKVVDYNALFHPPDEFRARKHTKESLMKAREEIKEKNERLREEIKKKEQEGVNVACNRVVSNYDLSPRESSK